MLDGMKWTGYFGCLIDASDISCLYLTYTHDDTTLASIITEMMLKKTIWELAVACIVRLYRIRYLRAVGVRNMALDSYMAWKGGFGSPRVDDSAQIPSGL